jgi:hypothetical protein
MFIFFTIYHSYITFRCSDGRSGSDPVPGPGSHADVLLDILIRYRCSNYQIRDERGRR